MLTRYAAFAAVFAMPCVASSQQAAIGSCAVASPPAVRVPARVPITVINNHVYVEGCVGGRMLHFILDTGAGTSFFDLGVATELGLQPRGQVRGRGAGAGSVAGARLDTTRVHIGGTSILLATALDFSGVSLGEGFPVQGVLGYDFIARHVLEIDYEAGALTLHDSATFAYSGVGSVIPITSFARNHPHIRAELEVGGRTMPMTAIVDVGASTGLAITKPFVERNGLRARVTPTIRTHAGGGVGGPMMALVGRVDVLRIGAYALDKPVTHLFGDSAGVFSENLWDANIGGDVLRRFRVFLDYGRKRIILEPTDRLGDAFEGDMSGLRLRAVQRLDSLAVVHVQGGSPAEDAGVRVGDVIVAVDERPVTARTLRELRPRLRRPGEVVSLSLMRGHERLEVRLIMRRLI